MLIIIRFEFVFNGSKLLCFNISGISGDILAKPFTFVSGNTKKSRFNPFRKKSGLLNVLARQSTKNRICFKNGYLNTFTPSEENQAHKFLQDIFVSIIDLNWGWIYVIFAAAFFLSWLGFAIVWYLTFWVHGDFADGNLGNETYVPCASAITGFTLPRVSYFHWRLGIQSDMEESKTKPQFCAHLQVK